VVPPDRWITRIEPSHFDEGTAYLSIDRHRNDDRTPYVFKTSDYGETWKPLANDLPPGGPVHVIREDPRNQNLLYVGTEFNLFVSLDGGAHWKRLSNELPTVAVHDLLVHPRDRELIIGTHGRSIYIVDIAPLQELTPKVLAADVHLFDVQPATVGRARLTRGWAGTRTFLGTNPPAGTTIYYYLKETLNEAPLLTVADSAGNTVNQWKGVKEAGLHRVTWNPSPLGAGAFGGGAGTRPLPAGDYRVLLRIGERTWTKTVHVEAEK
jgi:hypothetical protein